MMEFIRHGRILKLEEIHKESNCGTRIELKDSVVYKTYQLNTLDAKYKPELSNLILEYFNSLLEAGINLPKLIDSDRKLNFKFSYCGQSVAKQLSHDPMNFYKKNEQLFEDIINICQLAINSNLHLDPHIRNFTNYNGKIYYVDIFPPYGEEYLDLLTQLNPHLKDKLTSLFSLFSPKMLPYHFLADFKKTFINEKKLLVIIEEKMKAMKIIDGHNPELIDWIINMEKEAYEIDRLPLF